MYEQLSGPVSLTYHHNILGRDFFILGDRHWSLSEMCADSKKSIELYKYLEKIFKKRTYPIDFFTEFSFISKYSDPKRIEARHDEMSRVINVLNPCLDPDKNLCVRSYPNLRFHYADMRWYVSDNKKIFSFFDKLYDIIDEDFKNSSDEELQSYKDFITSISTPLFTKIVKNYYTTKNFRNFFNEQSIQSTKSIKKTTNKKTTNKRTTNKRTTNKKIAIAKNFEPAPFRGNKWYLYTSEFYIDDYLTRIKRNIDKSLVKKPLMKFYQDKLKSIIKTHKVGTTFIEQGNFYQGLADIKSAYLQIGALQTDVYVLARAFKQTIPIKEAWLYFGDSHAERYREFIIKYLKFPDYIKADKITLRCLNLKKFQKILTL